jgi:BASS family bile acid:Na+ symporter
MTSTVTVVLLPLAAGLALQLAAPRAVQAASPFCPPLAVLVVALICGSIIANSASAVVSSGPMVLAACILLHAGGFALGYVSAWLLGFPEKVRRTVSVEVGMQNSALGAVLAMLHFGPAAAVPCALSATVHSVLGSMLAGGWRLRDARQ